jgi:tetratricopeptide (TPR) repeat protein
MDDYREQHQQLLDRFSAALKKGGTDDWFDEDELLTIFDYAGDIGNNYLRTEALMWGARYFPESKALLERRCVLYADVLDNDAVVSFTNDIADNGSLITNLLKYRAKGMTSDQAIKVLQGVLDDDSRKLNDEEVIQLVNFAFDTENSQWIYDNFEALRKKTTFMPTLLFEVAALSFECQSYNHTAMLLEELVSESPYNVEYWDMLSKAYFAADKTDEGTEALDMCLAIDPNYIPALEIKAHLLSLNGNVAEVSHMAAVHFDNPEIAEASVNAKLFAFNNDNSSEDLAGIISDLKCYAEIYPQSNAFIDKLLTLAPNEAHDALENIWFHQTSASDEQEVAYQWSEWANELAAEFKFGGALAVIEYYFSIHKKRDENTDRMRTTQAILYFIQKRWDKCYNIITDYPSEAMDSHFIISIAKVMCLIKFHKIKEARKLATELLNKRNEFNITEDVNWTGITQLAQVGLGVFLNHFIESSSPELISEFDADTYDPMHFWS